MQGKMSGVQLGRENLTIIIGGTIPSGPIQSAVTQGRSPTRAQAAGGDAPVALTPCPSPEYGRGEPELPPLTTQAANLFQSVVAFVGDGCGVVDNDQYRRRLDICQTCDRRAGKRCAACGCWINVKARGRAFRCPIGRWQ